MLLKVAKQLDQDLCAKLRVSHANICKFNNVENSSFLCQDLAQNKANIEEYLNSNKNRKFLIDVSLKNLKNPSHKLEACPSDSFYFSDSDRRLLAPNDLFLLLKLKMESGPIVTFDIEHTFGRSENSYRWDISAEDKNTKFNLRQFVAYFFYRKDFYSKIQKILEANKETLEAIVGAAFVADFLALFSVKPQVIADFKVPKKTVAKELILRHSDKAILFPHSLYLGGLSLDKFALMQEISFFLGEDNKLLIELVLSDEALEKAFPILTEKYAHEIKNDKQFEAKINEVTTAWLKDYIAFANFNAELYNKIKTKILLEKI